MKTTTRVAVIGGGVVGVSAEVPDQVRSGDEIPRGQPSEGLYDPSVEALPDGDGVEAVDFELRKNLFKLSVEQVDLADDLPLSTFERGGDLRAPGFGGVDSAYDGKQLPSQILLLVDQPLEIRSVFLLASGQLGEKFVVGDDAKESFKVSVKEPHEKDR